jgi:hypothetical protein
MNAIMNAAAIIATGLCSWGSIQLPHDLDLQFTLHYLLGPFGFGPFGFGPFGPGFFGPFGGGVAPPRPQKSGGS